MRIPYLTIVPLVLFVPSVPSRAQDPTVDRLKTYRFGGDKAILDSVGQRVAEARLNASLRAPVARALADILSSDAAFDAKQFACRQLAFIGSDEQVPALAALLKDEQLAHYALMALQQIPGPKVDDALRDALKTTTGHTQAEIADTLGARRDVASDPALVALLDGADEASVAAARALCRITTDNVTIELVEKAYRRADGDRKMAMGDALLLCANRIRFQDAKTARGIYTLLDDPAAAPILRAGALRGSAALDGAAGRSEVLKALHEDGTPRQRAAADLVRSLTAPGSAQAFANELPTLSPRGRAMLVAALADRGDASAAPAVAKLTEDTDPVVRLSAIRALGVLGGAQTVGSLLKASASTDKDEREAARSSLAQLRDPAVDQALLRMAGTDHTPYRAEAIVALGERRVTASLPIVVRAAGSTRSNVSSAAARVLRDMAGVEQLPGLLTHLLPAPPDNRSDLAETIAVVAERGATEKERTGVILDRLHKTAKPADRVELLTILRQVGGPSALAALRDAAKDGNAEVRSGAIRQLSEWTTDEPMPDLLSALKSATDRRQRTLALRGYIRMIGVNEQRSPAEALRLYRDAATMAVTPDEKRLILGGLGKVRSLGALELAQSFAKDSDLKAEAEQAMVEVGQSTAGAYREKTRAALGPIARDGANPAARSQAQAVLDRMAKFGDFVTAWEVSPVYARGGVGYSQLFDMAFPPEEPGKQAQVRWQLMPAGGGPDQPWLMDLLAVLGGEQRVAYLRTTVWSDTARAARLEMGSDDGIKIWMNGAVVHSNNTARAAAPGQDKFDVQLKAGRNDLLVKVTQNVMGWGACARFTSPDGSPATGIRCSIPSEK